MTTDKSKTVTSSIRLLNERLHFEGFVPGNEPISIDYIPPFGDNLGYTSLELFLLSLSSCAGTAMLVLLRKMNKNLAKFSITATGERKQQHPTGFESIELIVELESSDITNVDVDKMLEKMELICPVLSMLDKGIKTSFQIKINE